MQKLLIVESSEALRTELEREMRKKYRVISCGDGDEALRLLEEHQPDGMILDLLVCGTDGLSLLEVMPFRPKAIVVLSTGFPPYVQNQLHCLGIGYGILLPASVRNIARRMDSMITGGDLRPIEEQQRKIIRHLNRLSVPPLCGYRMLQVGIPLYAQDPNQLITKELYPAIAELCGNDNWLQVERGIRAAVRAGWVCRDDEVWKEYFPDTSRCPSNRKFLHRLSEVVGE